MEFYFLIRHFGRIQYIAIIKGRKKCSDCKWETENYHPEKVKFRKLNFWPGEKNHNFSILFNIDKIKISLKRTIEKSAKKI
jgi:hypothetical protein